MKTLVPPKVRSFTGKDPATAVARFTDGRQLRVVLKESEFDYVELRDRGGQILARHYGDLCNLRVDGLTFDRVLQYWRAAYDYAWKHRLSNPVPWAAIQTGTHQLSATEARRAARKGL